MNAFSSIPEALEELRKGNMIIVVDSPQRENQADIIFPAELVTEEKINFLMQVCRGFICVPITTQKALQLDLPLMVARQYNTEKTGVNFTVTVDAKNVIDFGISALDRVKTIQTIARKTAKPIDLIRPGHVFPLLVAENGLHERQGHTEATVALCELAGFQPCGVLCEVLNPDGNVAKGTELIEFAGKYKLKMVSIPDLVTYVKQQKQTRLRPADAKAMAGKQGSGGQVEKSSVMQETISSLPTKYGTFKISVYKSLTYDQEHALLTMGNISKQPVLTRIHSQCLTGDTLFSLKCDCGEQLQQSMQKISQEGKGIIIYLNQEGRSIGLVNKIKAYALQDKGYDTVEANEQLGFDADMRDYKIAAEILKDLGISQIRLLTNNPDKEHQLAEYGIEIVERIPLEIAPNSINNGYLRTKKQKLKHKLELV